MGSQDTHARDTDRQRAQGWKSGGKISKRKPVAGSARTLQPWIELGIICRTYYRRMLKKAETR